MASGGPSEITSSHYISHIATCADTATWIRKEPSENLWNVPNRMQNPHTFIPNTESLVVAVVVVWMIKKPWPYWGHCSSQLTVTDQHSHRRKLRKNCLNYCTFKLSEYKYKPNFLYKNKTKQKMTIPLVREKELNVDLMRQRIWRYHSHDERPHPLNYGKVCQIHWWATLSQEDTLLWASCWGHTILFYRPTSSELIEHILSHKWHSDNSTWLYEYSMWQFNNSHNMGLLTVSQAYSCPYCKRPHVTG